MGLLRVLNRKSRMYHKGMNRLFNLRNVIIVGVVTLIITFFKLIYSGELNPDNSHEPYRFVVSEKEIPKWKYPRPEVFVQKMEIDDHKHADSRPALSVPRIAKYCNHPSGQAAGDEGLVPKGFVLLNVQVVIRHGDRSPITKLPDGKHRDISCLTDVSSFSHVPKVSNYVHVMASAAQDLPKDSHFKMWGIYPSHPVCADGQLTGLGAIQHVLNGVHYSERYQHQHRLFDETNWYKRVVVQSTEVSRTYQSAVAFLYGLLPKFEMKKINIKRAYNINFCEFNVIGTSCNCQGIDNVHSKAIFECRAEKGYMEAMKRYKKLVHHLSEILDIDEHRLQWPAPLMDGLSVYACHDIPLPCNANKTCLTSRDLEAVWEPVDYLNSCLNRNPKYQSFARVNMMGLLVRIASEFKNAVKNISEPNFSLYSGHDTTVSPLIAALGLQDGVWPGYASRIAFELYRKESSQEHFIRVLQNGKVVTSEVMFCREVTENGFCNLSHFLSYIDANKSFDQFCHSVVSSLKAN